MHGKLLAIGAFLLVAIVAPSCVYTVDYAEYVYLTEFGKPLYTLDGSVDEEAGLHFKWPWPIQSVQRLDRRLQYFDLPSAELLTRDPKRNTIDRTLTLDAYVCWRIADARGVDAFVRSVGTPTGAQAILGQRITSELGAAIGQMELEDLISANPTKVDEAREALRSRLLQGSGSEGQSLEAMAETKFGIRVVDIRLRRTNHPLTVREAIFDRIRSERSKKRAEYESDGERQKKDIESAGARRVAEMKAEAETRAKALRDQADVEAERIRQAAQSKDPQFYSFLKQLEAYQRILGDNKSTLLLSTHREMFDTLFHPPKVGEEKNHEAKKQTNMGTNK